jgi:microsomal epoxide hydrolase
LPHLDLRDVTLAGWSLGVNEVLTFLEHHGAERIRALILIDGIVGFDPKPGTTNPLNVSDEEAAAMLLALQHDRRALMSDLIRGGVRKPHSDADLERLIDLTMAVPTTTAFTVMANYLLKPPDGRPTLRNVERPVLYVIADHLAWQAAIVKAVKPDVRVEVFRDAGHLFLVDEPERFNALVRNFVASLR